MLLIEWHRLVLTIAWSRASSILINFQLKEHRCTFSILRYKIYRSLKLLKNKIWYY
jgi:hypothetical protein